MVYRQTKHLYDLNAPQVAKLNSGIRTQKFCNKHQKKKSFAGQCAAPFLFGRVCRFAWTGSLLQSGQSFWESQSLCSPPHVCSFNSKAELNEGLPLSFLYLSAWPKGFVWRHLEFPFLVMKMGYGLVPKKIEKKAGVKQKQYSQHIS